MTTPPAVAAEQTVAIVDLETRGYIALLMRFPSIGRLKDALAIRDGRNEITICPSFLTSPLTDSLLKVETVQPAYADNAPLVMGFEVVNAAFDAALAREPRLIAFGEDVGKLGDVNQGFHDLQKKYGTMRVTDTGIREATIIGQAIGMAMRGLRPIAEIQYLDYLLYGLQVLSDDLATLLWRTKGGQKAPIIVRTRGHRLEGIWHSGSPMAAIIHLVRGMHVLVPRDMTRAAGFYNALLKAEEPGIVVEVLNGYRVKERMPNNIGEIIVRPGVPELVHPGGDVSVVTYGACVRIALEAAAKLSSAGIQAEVIDVQSLLPFDTHGVITESLRKPAGLFSSMRMFQAEPVLICSNRCSRDKRAING